MLTPCCAACDYVSDCNKTSGKLFRTRQHFRTLQQCVCDRWSCRLFICWHTCTFPLLLTYACPRWLMKTWRPCRMKCASADEGEIEGPTCVSCVSPGFWGDLLLTQEWKPQIKVFVLTKDKWDFSFRANGAGLCWLAQSVREKMSPGRHL